MKTKISAVESTIKKLSGLRATMSNEEQAVLDSIVVNYPKADEVAKPMMPSDMELGEVEGHVMTPAGVVTPVGVMTPVGRSHPNVESDEVEGHVMTPVGVLTPVGRSHPNILYDKEKGKYVLSGD